MIWSKKIVDRLWDENKQLHSILKASTSLEDARELLLQHINHAEKNIRLSRINIHPLEWSIIQSSAKVLRNIISKRCEKLTNESCMVYIYELAKNPSAEKKYKISKGFIEELRHLFAGISGRSKIYSQKDQPKFIKLKGREAAVERSDELDKMAKQTLRWIKKYKSGLDDDVIGARKENTERIKKFFNASNEEWNDYNWQLKNVIRDSRTLSNLIELSKYESKAIDLAKENSIPFGITPYYVSLMDKSNNRKHDHAVRAQVIPSLYYVEKMIDEKKSNKHSLDFMLEEDTSPIDLVVRRYPHIAIFKPYNTCAQICVYCQRNWEIKEVLAKDAIASTNKIKNAIEWFKNHEAIAEVLITGGDAFIMSDEMISYLLSEFSKIKHIERIRFGTRTPVVLPQRISNNLVNILSEYHKPGRREICIITHFEHSYEISPEARDSVQKIRKAGISVYNQMVFTVENSRRYEAANTRRILKLIGVDPYYTFVTKGKEETKDFRVPTARLIQEQKEEDRLMTGMMRLDETVYNVPKLGKNYLRAGQHHDIIMIRKDGSRVIEFHPWEKNISLVDVYLADDPPIYDYLAELKKRGEDLKDYKSIWYYY